jgi:hypothetical protein
MEPLKPGTVQDILGLAAPAPAASVQDDIDEYERLLSERFTRDPDLPMSPQEADDVARREDRIAQLSQKLFRRPATNPGSKGQSGTNP